MDLGDSRRGVEVQSEEVSLQAVAENGQRGSSSYGDGEVVPSLGSEGAVLMGMGRLFHHWGAREQFLWGWGGCSITGERGWRSSAVGTIGIYTTGHSNTAEQGQSRGDRAGRGQSRVWDRAGCGTEQGVGRAGGTEQGGDRAGCGTEQGVGQSRVGTEQGVGQSRVWAEQGGQSRAGTEQGVGQSRVGTEQNVGQSRDGAEQSVGQSRVGTEQGGDRAGRGQSRVGTEQGVGQQGQSRDRVGTEQSRDRAEQGQSRVGTEQGVGQGADSRDRAGTEQSRDRIGCDTPLGNSALAQFATQAILVIAVIHLDVQASLGRICTQCFQGLWH